MGVGRIETEQQLRDFVRRELGLAVNVQGKVALLFQGSGTPEANVVAPVGAIFQRLDGGAGTSFYVKESGTGATGWVAK